MTAGKISVYPAGLYNLKLSPSGQWSREDHLKDIKHTRTSRSWSTGLCPKAAKIILVLLRSYCLTSVGNSRRLSPHKTLGP
jgi:hypothetical protein